MKKHGFTLAEVLITLGIIGVVAALTAPALVSNSRNEANAAKLAVVVSNLENAFSNAITSEGVDSLYQTSMWTLGAVNGNSNNATKAQFTGRLGKYLRVNGFTDSMSDYYDGIRVYPMTNTGSANTDNPVNLANINYFGIKLKNGAVVFFSTLEDVAANRRDENTVRNRGGSLYAEAADIYIDVNGQNPPNTFGRDIFTFYTGSDGVLYPFGGLDAAIFDSENDQNNNGTIWNDPNSDYACTNAVKKIDGLGCTARLIDEGYKMNY